MAPSSLKKMSGVQQRKEGSYASLEKTPLGKLTNHDLGLTLLPRSQSWRKDEKRSEIAAADSPKQSGSQYVETSEQLNSSETEFQSKCPAQETAFPTKAKSPSSSPDPGPDSARFSHVTSRRNGERTLSRSLPAKISSGVVDYNDNPLAAAPCVEQTKVTGEVRNASSRGNYGRSPRAAKRRRVGSRAFNQTQESKVSKEHEAALEFHSNRNLMYSDQSLSGADFVRSGKPSISFETIRDPDRRTGKGLGSSKAESCRQITHSLGTAGSHQETNVGSEVTALDSNSSVIAALASKNQNPESEKLIEHYQPSFSSQSFSTQHGKHSRLFRESPADIGTQVLKPREEVNRSSTRPFPKKAKKIQRANRPASSLASFTPGQHYLHHTNTLSTSTHLHANTHISNSHPSHSLPITLDLSKDFKHPSNVSALEDISLTPRATNQPQSLPRRSASVPNLSLTSAGPKMDFSNNLGSASMPTPPRENLRPLEASNQQQMTGAPVSKAWELAASEQRYSRPRLEVKSNYSLEEVKFLVSNLDRQARILKAENINLQSVNAAMKKGYENLQHEKADLLEQVQRYERSSAHKDQQFREMQLRGSTLLQQYKRVWDEHHQLLTKLRKEDGTGNPTAIAQTIRLNHSPNTPSRCNPPSANASSYCANGAQLSAPSHGVAQTSAYFHGPVQPMFVPSNHQLGVTGGTATINGRVDSPHMQQAPTERVTIDLTDDSQSPSSSASPDAWVHQTRHSSVQSGYPPSNLPPGICPPAQYPAGYSLMSQNSPELSARGEDLIAMRIQGDNMARIAKKDLSWLKGENPFRKVTRPPIWGQPSQSNAEEHVLPAQIPEPGRVAPLPETATRRTTKTQASKKTRVALDDEAIRERRKVYRRTAAEKKKREKELAKQAPQTKETPSNGLRALKQVRRASKGDKRQEQARKPSEEVGSWEPQKTLDRRLYQEDTGVQQAMYGGSMYQAASDDQDSLFNGSEGDAADLANTDIEMHDDAAAAEEQARARLAAEIEAELEADAEEGIDAGRMKDFEKDASGGQDYIPTAVAYDDHGFHDFSDESEESEEE